MPQTATAAILVGGQARRFHGQVKAELAIGPQTILTRQLAAIRAAGIDDVLIVGRWMGAPVPHARHVPDVVDGGGPLAGLYSALLVATTATVLILAGDMPFVTAPLLRRLATPATGDEALVPKTAGRWHPLCASYQRSVALRIKPRLDRGALRVTDALAEMQVHELSGDALTALDPAGTLLANVNTPDDHQRALDHSRD
jgi:molybdopterin-guanine dinucleotide biosynthesis protein A